MDDDIAISVSNLTKEFILPHEKNSTLKGSIINFARKKTFEHQVALKDVSFEIKKGEFFGIVGRNGSGKSTLLKCIAGVYQPTKGSVQVNGSLTPFIELGVGFNPELSARDNVFLNGALLGFSRKEMQKKYNDIVEFAELERFMDQKLKNYSSGMQVRLAFAIAIRVQSDILLIDEVLAVGDAAFQQKCLTYFEKLKAQGKTVVFVSHDMEVVRRFCTQAVYISNAKLLKQGTVSEIANYYIKDNIQATTSESHASVNKTKNSKISVKVTKQDKQKVVFEFTFKTQQKDNLFIGLSIIRNGLSVAEISTEKSLALQGKGKVLYTLDKNLFNGGMYSVGAGLFKLQNRELISVADKTTEFAVDANDLSRGSALKLPARWGVGN